MLDTLKILPLGGLGEIGVNAMLFEYSHTSVLIDCGVQFPDASFPGVELFVPDFSPVLRNVEQLKAVVVTHGHDDHIGAIPYLCREVETLEVYCTPFPEGLIRHKLEEHNLLDTVVFKRIIPGQRFKVGELEFEPIPVAHSIVEALGFVIRTPVGNIVHSGDFKHDPTPFHGVSVDFKKFEAAGKEGVKLLFSDSTNAENPGHTLSEEDIIGSFEKIFSEQKGRIFIALFASNVRRVEKLLQLAHTMNKKVALVGRSMHLYSGLAKDNGLLDVPPTTLIAAEEVAGYKPEDIIILATGSQAEPQSALVRMAYGTHRDLTIREGDLILLSSRFIPGNERSITDMIDQLCRMGADVIYESIHQIHVSGHGCQDELLLMLNAVKPEYFVPVHGEYRHLSKHAKLARSSGVEERNTFVVEDGQTILVTKKGVTLGERLELQKTVVVQGQPMASDPEVFQKRMSLAKAGVVFCALLRDEKGKMLSRPILVSYALLFRQGEEPAHVMAALEAEITDWIQRNTHRDDCMEQLQTEIRRFFRVRSMYKPTVFCKEFRPNKKPPTRRKKR